MTPFTVVVASGKGGTGKTLVATRLAARLAARGAKVAYIDADVDAPNGHLALNVTIEETRTVQRETAVIRAEACHACGECTGVCAFGALFLAPAMAVAVDAHCRDCRACELVCRWGAIGRARRPVGEIALGRVGTLQFLGGVLRIGEQRGVPLVDALRRLGRAAEIVVVDAPPGTACTTVAAVRDADLALLVTEPTPFGEHDLKLAVELCQSLAVPAAGILNRSGLGAPEYARVIERSGIEQWAEIPYDPRIAAAVASGEDPERVCPELAAAITSLAERVAARVTASSSPERMGTLPTLEGTWREAP